MKINRIRKLGRAYPFRFGRSEVKKILGMFIGREQLPVIEILPALSLQLSNLKDHNRIFWWFEEICPALYFYIRHFLPVEGLLVDVGASTGMLGFLAARLKSARVIALEPQERNCHLIRESLKINPEWANLYELIPHPCSSTNDHRFPDMRSVRLDNILAERRWERVDMIKIDTDGHEMEVLDSMGYWLDCKKVSALFVEMRATDIHLFERLSNAGYTAFGVNKNKLPFLLKSGMNQTEQDWFTYIANADSDYDYEDMLWVAADSKLALHLQKYQAK